MSAGPYIIADDCILCTKQQVQELYETSIRIAISANNPEAREHCAHLEKLLKQLEGESLLAVCLKGHKRARELLLEKGAKTSLGNTEGYQSSAETQQSRNLLVSDEQKQKPAAARSAAEAKPAAPSVLFPKGVLSKPNAVPLSTPKPTAEAKQPFASGFLSGKRW